jgi:type VI secretion system protein ImpA
MDEIGNHVDLALAAEPFAGESPSGEDLRLEDGHGSIYSRLRDARLEARAAERASDGDPELGDALPPQWSVVRDLALEALSTRTKDVEIACWLTESLTRSHGLAGLADGSELIARLIDRFWDDGLFPAADADDPEGRLIALTGLSGQDRDGSLMQPLRKTELFARPDGSPVTLWSFERSMNIAAMGEDAGRTSRVAEGVVPFADLEAEARGPGRAALQALARDAERAGAGWRLMEDAVGRAAPEPMRPSTGRVRGLLETLRRLSVRYLPEESAVAPGPQEQTAGEAAPDRAGAAPIQDARLRQGREALLDDILRIATAFRLNEPNSPVSFTLEEVVRRARMPWPDLLRELMPDANVRLAVMTSAGLRPPDSSTATEPQN